ncbi:MAG: tRNA lysidine(34) synthetase TilS [Acidobacteriota bacterium]
MTAPGDRLGVALSGGGDSVALLHILLRLGYPLHALHLNHLLRGKESDRDEQFVRDLCVSLGVPLDVRRTDASAPGGNLESAGRHLRRTFFVDSMTTHALSRIALGHTRSDQSETVLFRLLRGSAPRGLAGILPVTREGLIRPLLDLSREEVRAWLTSENLTWRDDSTNLDTSRQRSRLRHSLLPALARDYNPAVEEALARLAQLSYEDERYWESLTSRLLAKYFQQGPAGSLTATAPTIAKLPSALRRRLLRAAMNAVRDPGPELTFDHIEQALAILASPSASATLPGLLLERSFDRLRIAQPSPPHAPTQTTLPGPGRWPVPGGEFILHLRVYNTDGSGLDPAILDQPLFVRGWRPGDGYRPRGAARRLKLKELFQRARIPSWERSNWPILWMNDRIVWSWQFGPAAEFTAAPTAARSVAASFLPQSEES